MDGGPELDVGLRGSLSGVASALHTAASVLRAAEAPAMHAQLKASVGESTIAGGES